VYEYEVVIPGGYLPIDISRANPIDACVTEYNLGGVCFSFFLDFDRQKLVRTITSSLLTYFCIIVLVKTFKINVNTELS
jgi:hypothetical protein